MNFFFAIKKLCKVNLKKCFSNSFQSEIPSGPPRVTQAQKKEMMLLDLGNRVTTEEVGLDEVLEGDRQLRKRFPDAERLLGEVS